MKIFVLGDTHGRPNWKIIISAEKFDKLIFTGDYFDSYDDLISPENQIRNFMELVDYKKANMEKVILLLGNHDFHYLKKADSIYSGFQFHAEKKIRLVLEDSLKNELLQICYSYGNFLFSHAGITKTWVRNNRINNNELVLSINQLFKSNIQAFNFYHGKNSCKFGDDIYQSPIWVRPESLLEDAVEGYIQIVGHTVQDILILSDKIILIDTLGTSGQFLLIDNNELKVIEQPGINKLP